jgi:hypothetical protein
MGILDDPTNPLAIEGRRRSVVMTPSGQNAAMNDTERSACSRSFNASKTNGRR